MISKLIDKIIGKNQTPTVLSVNNAQQTSARSAKTDAMAHVKRYNLALAQCKNPERAKTLRKELEYYQHLLNAPIIGEDI